MFGLLNAMGFDTSIPHVQAGFLSFIGVVLTGGVAILTWWLNRQKDRKDALALRAEKRQDLLRANRSDIFPVWAGLFELGPLEFRFPKEQRLSVEKARLENKRPVTPELGVGQ